VLEIIIVFGRALALACRGDRELVLENLALRQHLNAFKRRGIRRSSDARPAVLDRLGKDVAHRAPSCSSGPTPWCDGTARPAGDGRGTRRVSVRPSVDGNHHSYAGEPDGHG
jgi:hypothetical protein